MRKRRSKREKGRARYLDIDTTPILSTLTDAGKAGQVRCYEESFCHQENALQLNETYALSLSLSLSLSLFVATGQLSTCARKASITSIANLDVSTI